MEFFNRKNITCCTRVNSANFPLDPEITSGALVSQPYITVQSPDLNDVDLPLEGRW